MQVLKKKKHHYNFPFKLFEILKLAVPAVPVVKKQVKYFHVLFSEFFSKKKIRIRVVYII